MGTILPEGGPSTKAMAVVGAVGTVIQLASLFVLSTSSLDLMKEATLAAVVLACMATIGDFVRQPPFQPNKLRWTLACNTLVMFNIAKVTLSWLTSAATLPTMVFSPVNPVIIALGTCVAWGIGLVLDERRAKG